MRGGKGGRKIRGLRNSNGERDKNSGESKEKK